MKHIKSQESFINEGIHEKYTPGDKMSKKFDYKGMMKFAMKVNSNTPLEMLQGLEDSLEDVGLRMKEREAHVEAITFMLFDALPKMEKIQNDSKLDPETKEKLTAQVDDILKKINTRAKVGFSYSDRPMIYTTGQGYL